MGVGEWVWTLETPFPYQRMIPIPDLRAQLTLSKLEEVHLID
jgi:hypothetical protein